MKPEDFKKAIGSPFIEAKQATESTVDEQPDRNCVTLPNGDCIAPNPCMHTPEKTAIMHSMCADPCGPECPTPLPARACTFLEPGGCSGPCTDNRDCELAKCSHCNEWHPAWIFSCEKAKLYRETGSVLDGD
jgi:hypothetical protein